MPRPDPLAAALARLAPPDPGPDSDLVRRAAGGDRTALDGLGRRHGPMVLGVCRRRLGPGPDCDDAFQVTFLVLARDIHRITDPRAVGGWLHRVAHLSALKLPVRRRRLGPLPADPAGRDPGPAEAAEVSEARAAVDAEVAALPAKLRAAVVLCGLRGRTNREAADLLGLPVGTVDSRLAAARNLLRKRLTRRGFGPPLLAAGALWADVAGGVAPRLSAALAERTVRAAAGYVAAGGVGPLSLIADGVVPAMMTLKLKLVVAAAVVAAGLGTAGLGVFRAGAGDGPKSDGPQAAAKPEAGPVPKAEPAPKPPEAPRPIKKDDRPPTVVLRDMLKMKVVLDSPIQGQTVRGLLDMLRDKYRVPVMFDRAEFARMGRNLEGDDGLLDNKFRSGESLDGLTLEEFLTAVLADLTGGNSDPQGRGRMAIRVSGTRILIVPAYEADRCQTSPRQLLEQQMGPPVSVLFDEVPLAAAVRELRDRTGANIVLDGRCRADKTADTPVTATFTDVRVRTVLDLLADMCGLESVWIDNVFYITTPANAASLRKQLKGRPDYPGQGRRGLGCGLW